MPVGVPEPAGADRAARVRPRRRAPRRAVRRRLSRGWSPRGGSGVPTVAVYQTDVAGFASSYGLGLTARAAWRWTCRLHGQADRTLAPSSWAVAALRARGVPRVHRWGAGVDTSRFTPSQRDGDCGASWPPAASCSSATSAGWRRRSRWSGSRCSPGCRACGWWSSASGPERGSGCAQALPHGGVPRLPRRRRSWRGSTPRSTCSSTPDRRRRSARPCRRRSRPGCPSSPRTRAARATSCCPDAPASSCHPGPRRRTGRPRAASRPTAGAGRRARAHRPLCVARFAAAARRSVLRRTWSTVGDELIAHYREVTPTPPRPLPRDTDPRVFGFYGPRHGRNGVPAPSRSGSWHGIGGGAERGCTAGRDRHETHTGAPNTTPTCGSA